MRQYTIDGRGSYGAFILLGAFAVCIVTVGYFISVSGIYSSVRGEALGHSVTYESISKLDLLRIVEKAALVASREGAENGWNEDDIERRFKEISEEWIASYLEERGVYGVDITVEKKSEMKKKGEETYVDRGRYVVVISGRGAKTEMLLD